jgi:hypothetical protein
MWLDSADLGDVPTWIGAVAAIVTVMVTIFALIFAKRAAEATRAMLDVESARDREREQAEARGQAELISAWYGFFDDYPGAAMSTYNDYWGAYIRNASPLPIYDLEIEFFYKGSDGNVTGPRSTLNAGMVPPTDSPGFAPAPLEMLRNVENRDPYVVAITFRDSAGRRSRRDHDGVLAEAE